MGIDIQDPRRFPERQILFIIRPVSFDAQASCDDPGIDAAARERFVLTGEPDIAGNGQGPLLSLLIDSGRDFKISHLPTDGIIDIKVNIFQVDRQPRRDNVLIGKCHGAMMNDNSPDLNGRGLLAFQEVTDIEDAVAVPVQYAYRFLKMHLFDDDFSPEQGKDGYFEGNSLYRCESVPPIFSLILIPLKVKVGPK
ncbi:MAG: hypothetical protein MZW92_45185 [Comamonadaceae bacterium]|nr:hypothetical protein [Comamonadaceae bacterium]